MDIAIVYPYIRVSWQIMLFQANHIKLGIQNPGLHRPSIDFTTAVRHSFYIFRKYEGTAHLLRLYTTKTWDETNFITFGSSLGNSISNPIVIPLETFVTVSESTTSNKNNLRLFSLPSHPNQLIRQVPACSMAGHDY